MMVAMSLMSDGLVYRHKVLAMPTLKLCRENKLKKYGMFPTIHYRVSPYDGWKQPIMKFSGEIADDALIETIKPFVVWECFKYKVELV